MLADGRSIAEIVVGQRITPNTVQVYHARRLAQTGRAATKGRSDREPIIWADATDRYRGA
jgi:hypothetical protein